MPSRRKNFLKSISSLFLLVFQNVVVFDACKFKACDFDPFPPPPFSFKMCQRLKRIPPRELEPIWPQKDQKKIMKF